jgi:hypothetical protein
MIGLSAIDKRLQESFGIKKNIDEVTVGNMVRLMGIPETDAIRLHSLYGNSNAIAEAYKVYYDFYKKNQISDQVFMYLLSNFVKQYKNLLEEMREFFKRFPKEELIFVKRIKNKEFTDVDDLFSAFKHLSIEKQYRKPNLPTVLSFDDGFKWVLLSDQKDCDDEGILMKHCGGAHGTMYSLRDSNDKPHVTIDVEHFGKNIISQLRGRANTQPKEQYTVYIVAFAKKMNAFLSDSELDKEYQKNINLKAFFDKKIDNDDMIDNESVVHEAPTKKDSPAITAQRNLPREIVNAITSQSTLRQTVWSLSHLPKGTQSARLIRYMEDKGWRSFTVNGKKLFYHARTYKLREPVKSVPQTLYGIYSLLKPLEQDDMGREMVDLKLQKLWGIREIPGSSGMEFVQSSVPSERLLRYLTSVAPNANELADQLYRHTGISIEPITSTMEIGTPVDYKNASRTDLPDGVLPEDIIVIAEGGSMYSLLAKNFTAGVVHDSSAVIDSGSIKVQGKQDPTPSSARGEPSASGLGKDWEDLRSKYGMNKNKDFGKESFDDVQEDNVKIVGTGFLWRVYKKAKESNIQSIFFVQEGSKSIDTMRASLSYSRGGIYDENVRVARNIRKTGGLPIRAGKWETEDLGKYLRMFHRDYGTTL